jgi:topoisomerase IA-like protein
LYPLPNTFGKKSGKCRQDRGIFASQGRFGPFSWRSKDTAYLAFC